MASAESAGMVVFECGGAGKERILSVPERA